MKITLECSEGWTYISWQRVIARGDDGETYNRECVLAFNELNLEADDRLRLDVDCSCFFVLSGESFTLEDFADQLGMLLGIEVGVKDANS